MVKYIQKPRFSETTHHHNPVELNRYLNGRENLKSPICIPLSYIIIYIRMRADCFRNTLINYDLTRESDVPGAP